MQLPNLAGIATTDLVETIGGGNFKASYINWSRTLQLLREHAPGWLPETVPNADGNLLHAAPVGCYLLIRFRNGEQVTPAVPQAVMDTRNSAIPHDKITARDLTDTHRRGICLAAAMTFGLAYELWAKLPLESGYEEEKKDEKQERRNTPKPPTAPPPPNPPAAPLTSATTVNVDALIKKCTMTATIEGMELWRDEIRRVPKGQDRNRLMEAIKRRVEEIKQEMERERQAREEPAILEAEEGVI
jgi:hypothetical protein